MPAPLLSYAARRLLAKQLYAEAAYRAQAQASQGVLNYMEATSRAGAPLKRPTKAEVKRFMP